MFFWIFWAGLVGLIFYVGIDNILAGQNGSTVIIMGLCLAAFGLIPLVKNLRRMRLSLGTSPLGRRLIGLFWEWPIRYAIAFGLMVLPLFVLGHLSRAIQGFSLLDMLVGVLPDWLFGALFIAYIYGAWFVLAVFYVRPGVAAIVGPIHEALRSMRMGRGGSARFAGLIAEWGSLYKPGALFLGTSLYNPDLKIGHTDDRGMFTLASARSGKGRSGIIPNLLMWPGSALVIDPKGTNATITAPARNKYSFGISKLRFAYEICMELFRGGKKINIPANASPCEKLRLNNLAYYKTFILDPFRQVKGKAADYRVRYNPLDTLNPESLEIVEEINLIADALVVPEQGSDNWDEGGRAILSGIMAHLLKTRAKGNITLADVRDMVILPLERLEKVLLPHSQGRDVLSRLVATALSQVDTGFGEAGGYIGVARKNTKWLDSEVMRDVLKCSDFSIDQLKEKPIAIYLVLPPHLLETHSRFLRLFVNLSIRTMTKGARSKHKMLFILDEFYSLGTMTTLQKASSALPSYGVKLWPIVQNLGQIIELYRENWETFLSNAGAVQVFGINDKITAEYVADRLGYHEIDQSAPGWRGKQGEVERAVYQLRQAEELQRQTSRESGVQIVLRSGADPFLLRRANYDEMFKTSAYEPDPDHAPGHYQKDLRELMYALWDLPSIDDEEDEPEAPKGEGPGPGQSWQEWIQERSRAEYEKETRTRDAQAGEQKRQADERARKAKEEKARRAKQEKAKAKATADDTEPWGLKGDAAYRRALEIMGLSDGFTKADLRRRYRDLHSRVHPDTGNPSDYFAKQLNWAKEILEKYAS